MLGSSVARPFLRDQWQVGSRRQQRPPAQSLYANSTMVRETRLSAVAEMVNRPQPTAAERVLCSPPSGTARRQLHQNNRHHAAGFPYSTDVCFRGKTEWRIRFPRYRLHRWQSNIAASSNAGQRCAAHGDRRQLPRNRPPSQHNMVRSPDPVGAGTLAQASPHGECQRPASIGRTLFKMSIALDRGKA